MSSPCYLMRNNSPNVQVVDTGSRFINPAYVNVMLTSLIAYSHTAMIMADLMQVNSHDRLMAMSKQAKGFVTSNFKGRGLPLS
jgi:hypothetical protein